MHRTDLPHEILEAILTSCQPAQLALLSSVSKHIQPIAERLLYHSIQLNCRKREVLDDCLGTLCDNLCKAGLVRFLAVSLYSLSAPARQEEPNRKSVAKLSKALSHMVGLEFLSFRFNWGMPKSERRIVEDVIWLAIYHLESPFPTH